MFSSLKNTEPIASYKVSFIPTQESTLKMASGDHSGFLCSQYHLWKPELYL